jgi:hypothetical protein
LKPNEEFHDVNVSFCFWDLQISLLVAFFAAQELRWF